MGPWPFNQRRPRLRRFGKWLGLVVVMVFLAVEVASVWWAAWIEWRHADYQAPDAMIGVAGGRVYVLWRQPWRGGGWLARTGSNHEGFRWGWQWERMAYGGTTITDGDIPLWPLGVALASATAWLWWRDRPSRRRRLAGQCIKCGYDLTGLGGKPCPECGGDPAHR
ncbi:MAG: hypothetical protein ACREJO_15530 [Phycisphaerales bacterium]